MKATSDKTWARQITPILKTSIEKGGKKASMNKRFQKAPEIPQKKRKCQFFDFASSKKKVLKHSRHNDSDHSSEELDFSEIDDNSAESDIDTNSEDSGSSSDENTVSKVDFDIKKSADDSESSESETAETESLEQLDRENSEESDDEGEITESSEESDVSDNVSEESDNEKREVQNSSSNEETDDNDKAVKNEVSDSENSDDKNKSTGKMAQDASVGAVDGEEAINGNPGWADAMSKILKMKKPKKKKVLVLSRAKKDFQVKQKPDFEIVGDSQEATEKVKGPSVKTKTGEESSAFRKKLDKFHGWERVGRVKPNVLNKNRERMLCKIATQGVVQLFNTFKDQKRPTTAGAKERTAKKKAALKDHKIDRRAFLDMLKGSAKSIPVKGKSEEQPAWGVLRDDFTKSAKMRDWDKEEEEDDDEDDREMEFEME